MFGGDSGARDGDGPAAGRAERLSATRQDEVALPRRPKKTLQVMRAEPPTGEFAAVGGPRPEPTIFGLTDRGCVRENNEDQFLIAKLERSVLLQQSGFPIPDGTRLSQPSPLLLMVADGMGGHDGGEVASAVAIDAMAHYAFTTMPWLDVQGKSDQELVEGLVAAVRQAQDRMLRVAARKQLDARMGSTLTMAYVAWPSLLLFHVGDSRAYLYREGELRQLTADHNLAHEMVSHSLMTVDEARRSHFTSVLTNALGGGSDRLEVEIHRTNLQEGDSVLLCTDGLHGELADEDIERHLALLEGPQGVTDCVNGLVEAAKIAGGGDNLTVVLARF